MIIRRIDMVNRSRETTIVQVSAELEIEITAQKDEMIVRLKGPTENITYHWVTYFKAHAPENVGGS